jgi:hypothetical protein
LNGNAVEVWMRWSTTIDPPLSVGIIDNQRDFENYITQWQPPQWLLDSFHPDLLLEARDTAHSSIRGTSQENFTDFLAELTQFFRSELGRGLARIEEIQRVEHLCKPDLTKQLASLIEATASPRQPTATSDKPHRKLSSQEVDKYIEKHRVEFWDTKQGWDRLTPAQLQAASLRWECGLPVNKIAGLLGIHPKSVDDRLNGAEQKITAAGGTFRKEKRKAKSGPKY